MRLSDAIRLGAMLRPQAFRGLFADHGSCALGAALDAIGAGIDLGGRYPLDRFEGAPAIREVEIPCRCPWYMGGLPLDTAIVHLNDSHHWTRERIADWVATLEGPTPDVASDPPVQEAGPTSTALVVA